jgi:hypothetical protein
MQSVEKNARIISELDHDCFSQCFSLCSSILSEQLILFVYIQSTHIRYFLKHPVSKNNNYRRSVYGIIKVLKCI